MLCPEMPVPKWLVNQRKDGTAVRTMLRNRLVVPLLLAFLSGFSALAYETLWQRILTDILGSVNSASIIVITVFFCALSGGAILFRKHRLLRDAPWTLFALLEIGIGLSLVPTLALSYNGFTLDTSDASPVIRSLMELSLAIPLIGMPGLLMGGTLLALINASVQDTKGRVSLLYGVNTLGGAAGILVAGFYSIYHLGVRESVIFFMTINLSVAAVALMMGRRWSQRKPISIATGSSAGSGPYWPYIASFTSGLTIFTFEIVLLNAYGQVGQNSSWSFSAMLVLVIVFLGISPILSATISKGRTAFVMLALLVASPLAALFPELFFRITDGLSFVSSASGDLGEYLRNLMMVGALSAGPFLLVAGFVFPKCMEVVAQETGNNERALGLLLGLNTLGAVSGVLLTQFVLLPFLSLWYSAAVIATFPLVTAVLVAKNHPMRVSGYRPLVVVLSAVALVAIGLRFTNTLPLTSVRAGETLVELRTGPEGIVAVKKDRNDVWTLSHNNYYYLSTTNSEELNLRMGHIPLLLHPAPEDILYIGFATGLTSSAAVSHDAVNSITVCETSPLVIELAQKHFGQFTGNSHEDPRVSIIEADGVHYAASTGRRFDVITGDLFFSWCRGVSRLYSIEHFQNVKKKLKAGGIFCQWFPMWQYDEASFAVVARTFREVFPGALVLRFSSRGRTVVGLVGFRDDHPDPAALGRNWDNNLRATPAASGPLRDIPSFADVFAGAIAEDKDMNAELNRINRPILEPIVIELEAALSG